MKVGDRLYCHNSHNSVGTLHWFNITGGDVYIITELSLGLCIYFADDDGIMCWVSLEIDNCWHYSKWFYIEKEYRKMKLDKLNEFF